MNLAIDIGNTRVKIGLFQGEQLLMQEIWIGLDILKLNQIVTNHPVQNIIYSSTAHLEQAFLDWGAQQNNCMALTPSTLLPIKNEYGTPQTLGKDRIAAAVGAYALYPQTNCLVVDAGTCITYEMISENGSYLGGNIAPGMQMRLQAMHHFTAKLPLVEQGEIVQKIGTSTTTALRNGALWGAVLEIEGVIEWFKDQFGLVNVILTGGDADFFGKNLKTEIFAHPNLVLIGLNKILTYNVEFFE